jgi:hypothetical protein
MLLSTTREAFSVRTQSRHATLDTGMAATDLVTLPNVDELEARLRKLEQSVGTSEHLGPAAWAWARQVYK